jgi:ATP-dependent helicase Lhr and Lhr-like helicase
MNQERPRSTISQEIRRLKKRDARTETSTPVELQSRDSRRQISPTKKRATARQPQVKASPRKQRPKFEAVTREEAEAKVSAWFSSKGWAPFPFQRDLWNARLEGRSGLLHVPTGAGKTYAAFIGALMKAMTTEEPAGTRILYITPLKAVSRDIRLALEEATDALCPSFHVEDRTGDTSQHVRARQRLGAPEVLVTTPESLSLLLSHADHQTFFGALETVILDEWHELLGNKRGSLLELALSRLKAVRPTLSTWALTATIANLDEAARAAAGYDAKVITASIDRPVIIESLLPPKIDSFPWAGSLGLRMSASLIEWLDPEVSTLIFTNTRGQAERWYQEIAAKKPDWVPRMALHHGSIEREDRERAEAGIKSGEIKLVVATSSLDLGVDFGPVERVVQIGSPKGIARLLQRAGRASHRPGASSQVLFVPTHALELIEIASIRRAISQKIVEARRPIAKPIDVLVQHLVTRALGGGFTRDEIFEEVRHADAFKDLTDEELDWALLFITQGGTSLQAYASFKRVVIEDGIYKVTDGRIARTHRMGIGTISSDARVRLKFQRGREIGTMEESFISRLKPGDKFLFSGKILQFKRLENMNAIVKMASGSATVSSHFAGERLPYSEPLAKAVRNTLTRYANCEEDKDPEGPAIEPILSAQRRFAALPHENEILIELARTRDGDHFFIYPFEGRGLHEALGSILALRLAKRTKATFSITVNDYGIELLSAEEFHYMPSIDADLLTLDRVEEDLTEALNLTQMARQKFREIARVAGLLHPGHPSARKTARQLQASAGLLYDVLKKYEPNHPLILQAEKQALAELVDTGRLRETLQRITNAKRLVYQVKRPTPLGFPLLVERWGSKLSTESLAERIERLKAQWVKV